MVQVTLLLMVAGMCSTTSFKRRLPVLTRVTVNSTNCPAGQDTGADTVKIKAQHLCQLYSYALLACYLAVNQLQHTTLYPSAARLSVCR